MRQKQLLTAYKRTEATAWAAYLVEAPAWAAYEQAATKIEENIKMTKVLQPNLNKIIETYRDNFPAQTGALRATLSSVLIHVKVGNLRCSKRLCSLRCGVLNLKRLLTNQRITVYISHTHKETEDVRRLYG